jgi:hypothetical protein
MKMFFVFLVLTISGTAFAATVTAVKNKRIMISLDGEAASSGTEFFVINASGKKVAIVKVTQVKNGKAIAEISKGTAQVGYSLQLKGGGGKSGGSGSADSYYDKKLTNRARTGNSMGVVGGYLMNSMTASFIGGVFGSTYKVNADMAGSGFGALGFYDYAFSPRWVFRGMAGLEQYNVSGTITTPDCANTTNCSVSLTYLSMYGYGRYNILNEKTKWWAGLGYGYLYAMSKSATAINVSQVSANQIFMFSTGVDIRLSAKSYIPISLEYGMFPTSDSVSAKIIYLRAGYAWNL